jgi:flavin reductase (DIM6/NTAB) family NADH-FMN oxidoreductase RutF
MLELMGRRRAHAPRSPFGVFLANQLRTRGLAPGAFATTAGLSVSHVYQLLRGDRADPRGTTFHKVAAALDMSDAQLAQAVFADANGAPGPATPAQPLIMPPAPASGLMDRAAFFAIMSAFPTGVTIVTTLDDDGQPRGLTCTALCSLSADPPLLLVCVDRRSQTLETIRQNGHFVVNYLLAGRGELSNRFASREQDRWTDVAWRPAALGLPWLHADSLAYAECALVQEMEGGDHMILVGRVDGGQPPPPGTQPLMYFRRSYATWPQ